jgi:hypothetical protein
MEHSQVSIAPGKIVSQLHTNFMALVGACIFVLVGMLSSERLWWALLPPALYFGIHLVEGETLTRCCLRGVSKTRRCISLRQKHERFVRGPRVCSILLRHRVTARLAYPQNVRFG